MRQVLGRDALAGVLYLLDEGGCLGANGDSDDAARGGVPDGVGTNENWTQVCTFPLWSVGNRANDTTMGVTSWIGVTGYPCNPHLRLMRKDNTFYYYTSADGETWTSLPDLEEGVVRDDLPAELQVGIFQSNFTGDWQATMDFDNFSIETVPEVENEPEP